MSYDSLKEQAEILDLLKYTTQDNEYEESKDVSEDSPSSAKASKKRLNSKSKKKNENEFF